jgi:uncharacterized protein YprB with RNaseH-like and TPR domain
MGLPPDIFKRLSRLNRELVRDQVTTGDRAASLKPAAHDELVRAAEAVTLETVVPGIERRSRHGRFYEVRRKADEFRPEPSAADDLVDGAAVAARYRRVLFGAGAAAGPEGLSESLRPLLAVRPEAITYLDIETCGLAGEPLFLIGLMRWEEDTLRVNQFLARDYSEEGPILHGFWEALGGAECLVTFNGKTFDVPTIAARSAAVGLFRTPGLPAHVDLLHEARRRWKRTLPNCRLQTLEQLVCGRHRVGDIPGGDIPAAYHDFVRAYRGGDALVRARSLRRLQTIMHHNALDLVTMAELVTHLLAAGR